VARPSVEVERREQILRSACRVLAARGVVGLRIADVARGAGVSPGIVHYYFDTKLDLVRAAFEDNFARSLERRSSILDTDGGSVAVLYAVIESYLPVDDETVEAWRVWIELWAAALQDEALHEVHDQTYGRWRTIVADIIADGQARGELADGDTTTYANMLVSMLDGLAVQVLLGSSAVGVDTMRDLCRRFVDAVLSAAGR
jgi:AcrR family transcriptional regulator